MTNNYQNNKKDLLVELVKTSFKIKYNDSILGFVWVLLKPFLQFTILYVVFSQFGGNAEVKNYSMYLLVGLVIFGFFQEVIIGGIGALLEKANIILKVNFDKSLVIYSIMILGLINLAINFVIVAIFSLFNPIIFNLNSFLYFIFVMIISFIGVTGFNFITSIITIKVRDLKQISEIGIQLLFYATPIIYHISIVPGQYQDILKLNPFYYIIGAAREALIYGNIIFVREMVIASVISVVLFFAGRAFFKNKVKKVAEYF